MHRSGTQGSEPLRVLTQAQADSCCASSEPEQPGPSSATSAGTIAHAVLGPAVLLPERVPSLVLSDGWRMVTPVPRPLTPRHVLLSVFLV